MRHRVEYTKKGNIWTCWGEGGIGADGRTREEAYQAYLREWRLEQAHLLEEAADEAELTQYFLDQEGVDRDGDDFIGTSLHDHLAATCDVEAMREKAERLRRQVSA